MPDATFDWDPDMLVPRYVSVDSAIDACVEENPTWARISVWVWEDYVRLSEPVATVSSAHWVTRACRGQASP